MDDIVKQAMAKWPHVPHCHGWLGLGARGEWFMRDARTQQAGSFAGADSCPASRGAVLRHEALVAFIGRNYLADAQGCWYFQNGPQRVFVELEATPWILRLSAGSTDTGPTVTTHTGLAVQARQALCDEQGRAYLVTDLGLGLVHSLDTLQMADALEQGLWPLEEVEAATLPARYGYVVSPQHLTEALPS